MNSLKHRLERIEVEERVAIPTLDGSAVAETVTVKVPAWRDPKDGEVYLDGEATAILDRVKARHMGLLTPEELKQLRLRLRLTQKEVSELLQIGEKTWTRWESGRERPSRSINILLSGLNDGRLDVAYLQSLRHRRGHWAQLAADAGAGPVVLDWSEKLRSSLAMEGRGHLGDLPPQPPRAISVPTARPAKSSAAPAKTTFLGSWLHVGQHAKHQFLIKCVTVAARVSPSELSRTPSETTPGVCS